MRELNRWVSVEETGWRKGKLLGWKIPLRDPLTPKSIGTIPGGKGESFALKCRPDAEKEGKLGEAFKGRFVILRRIGGKRK